MLQDGHSAAPKLAGVQACQTGVGPRDQDRSHLQSAPSLQLGGAGTYDPARQVALYSTWGRVPMAAAAVAVAAARHHPSSQTHTLLTPTHTPRDRVVCSAYLSTVPVHDAQVSLNRHCRTQTTSFPSPRNASQTERVRDSARGVCRLQVLPCLPFLRLSFF